MSRPILRAALLGGLLGLAACASHPIRPWQYDPRPMADTLAIREPIERETSLVYDQVEGVVSGLGRAFSLTRKSGLPPALNADPFDEVVNSAWFTNRNGRERLSAEAIRRGPGAAEGPDQSAPVTVKSIKVEGVSPGFDIEDAAGDRYILKFDPPDHWEMASGAEVVATNLFWAAGYHVPENYVFYLDPSNLVLDEDLEATFQEGDSLVRYSTTPSPGERELTMEIFRRNILERFPRTADGRIRAMASKFLEGIPKGPFAYAGIRGDDPNDVIPHEHRRELRGLYVIAAWLNHVDAKQGNSLDMFILDERSPEEGPGIGHLRHNLLDFGSTLGSAAVRPHNFRHGTEREFDAGPVLLRFITLGIYERPWQDVDMDTLRFPPSIGYYSIDNFSPGDWRTNTVNPAFINRTDRDGYWGAKIVMSFTDEQLDAAVAAGQYSDPRAAQYLLEELKKRRDATGRYWFREVSPLDEPRVEGNSLVFDDLWIRHFGGPADYLWKLEWDAPDPDLESEGTASTASIPLPTPSAGVRASGDDAYARLEVWKVWEAGEEAERPATIWLAPEGGAWKVVGVRY
ncbi:MAG: hypothetical protein KY397_04540 [Gemmatimonadetes bacterium]|nr:hypothetical protein [Gemmatimonadota bacterium]